MTRGDFFGNDKAAVHEKMPADNVEKKMPRRMYGQTAIVLFLLAIFGLAVLAVGIGLTWWFVLPPS